MKKSLFTQYLLHKIIPLFLLTALMFQQNSVNAQDEPLTTLEHLKNDIKYLASDELQGRFTGSAGDKLAAEYIISAFKSSSVQSPSSGYEQQFPVTTGYGLGESSNIFFEVLIAREGIPKEKWRKRAKQWTPHSDWLPTAFSASGAVTGELVFAGYGITANELNYDDYQGIDVNGKIVILFSNSPEGFDTEGEFANYIGFKYKAENAIKHGASAVIIIRIQGDSANVFTPLTNAKGAEKLDIIAIQGNRTEIAQFFPRGTALFPLEQKINKNRKPESFILPNVSANITVELVDKVETTSNIIGLVKGTDPGLSNQYIIIGAHHDHLGKTEAVMRQLFHKAKVMNGADDNASGVAAVLELARRINADPLNRSVLFICFGAEEKGQLGSKHYTSNPIVPLENTACMINLDMVGRMKSDRINIFGMGSSALFKPIIDSTVIDVDIEIADSQNGFGVGDYTSFYKKNIPSLLFTTGMHEDHHKYSDDWRKINFKGEEKVINFVERIIKRIGMNENKPEFLNAGDISVDKPMSELSQTAWLGVLHSDEENEYGLKIRGTKAGSPARKAGLKANDIIIKFDDFQIKNIYDLTMSVQKHQPGDLVTITVLRGRDYEKEKIIQVTLSARK